MEGKNPFFSHILWLKLNFYLYVKFSMKALTNKGWIGCPKKEKTHLFISCSKKTKNFKKNWLLIVQVSKQNWTENFQFLDLKNKQKKQVIGSLTLKKCTCIFADSVSCEHCGDFGTWVGRWVKWNGGVANLSHIFHAIVVITGKP